MTLVGLATDFCVAYSALDAARLGFGVTVLMGACRAIDLEGSLAAACDQMRAAGVRLEDCFHMTEAGPKWFSTPPVSIEQPMG